MMDKHKYYANTYQTPNVLIDERLQDLDTFEFTLLSIIIRKTMGWGKRDEGDRISISQFKIIAPKISRRTIINKLEKLREKKLVEIIINKGKPNHYKLTELFFEETKMSSAGDAPVKGKVVQEMHHSSAGDAPVKGKVVQEMHHSSAGDAPTKPNIQNLINNKPTYTKSRQPAGGLWEVQLFFIEKGIADPLINAFKFYNHYEANGWVQGKNKPLKDWRAAPWSSWNFARSNGKLPVHYINHHESYEEYENRWIVEAERERIINGLMLDKLIITDDNTIEYHFSKEKEIKKDVQKQFDIDDVKKLISKQFQIQP